MRRTRLRAQRRWCEFDRDEMVATSSLWVPEDYALVRPVVDAYAQAVYERARRLGLRDPMEAYRADGVLAALAAAGEAIGITITLPTTTTSGVTITAPPPVESPRTATPAESPRTSAPDESTRTATTTTAAESTVTAAPAESTATAATESDTEPADEPSELEQLLAVRPGRVKWNVTILVDAIALKRGYATASRDL